MGCLYKREMEIDRKETGFKDGGLSLHNSMPLTINKYWEMILGARFFFTWKFTHEMIFFFFFVISMKQFGMINTQCIEHKKVKITFKFNFFAANSHNFKLFHSANF